MTQFATSIYTPAEQEAFLKADSRVISFKYEIFDGTSATSKGFFEDVLEGGSIQYSYLASIKRTGSLTLVENIVDSISRVNFLKDTMQIYVVLSVYDPLDGVVELTYPVGRFVLSSSTRVVEEGRVTRPVALYDIAKRLSDDTLDARVEIAAGTNVINYVSAFLASSGISRQKITPGSGTLQSTRSWEPGTSKLTFINELLDFTGRGSLWFDAEGFARSDPYQAPSDSPVTVTYTTDDQSVLTPKFSEDIDLGSVPNKWILVASQPDSTPLVATYINSNPDSPTSTVNRGYSVTYFSPENNEVTSQSALYELAKKKAVSDSQVYQKVEIETLLLPYHSEAEVIQLFHKDGMTQSAKYQETNWSYSLTTDSIMTHSLRRIVPVGSI